MVFWFLAKDEEIQ